MATYRVPTELEHANTTIRDQADDERQVRQEALFTPASCSVDFSLRQKTSVMWEG